MTNPAHVPGTEVALVEFPMSVDFTHFRVIKIHPAIGIARLSASPDYFIAGSFTDQYKSSGVIKRQAVQFQLFAFSEDGEAFELTSDRLKALGVTIVWHVRLSNRKLAARTGDDQLILGGEGHSDQDGGRVVARLPMFEEGDSVPLGSISAMGLFIPPISGVFRRNASIPLPEDMRTTHSTEVVDNTSDGYVTVTLEVSQTGRPVDVPVLPAWLVVAPPDFSPDQDDTQLPAGADGPRVSLDGFLRQKLGRPFPAEPVNHAAHALDVAALQPCTGRFNAGWEVSLGGMQRLSEQVYSPEELGDPGEIRLRPAGEADRPGVAPGDLTAYLCSPWQFDVVPCRCNFWAAQRPDVAFRDESGPEQVNWLRKRVADTSPEADQGRISTGADVVRYIDRLGIMRLRDGRLVETERTDDLP